MVQSLYDLLRDCTVRISVQKQQGTGFFVAPGMILTCSHVVEAAQQQDVAIEVFWKGQTLNAQIKEFRATPYPDCALLQTSFTEHSCVYLDKDVRPFDKLYSYGYPEDYPSGDSVTLSCEGSAGGEQPLLKLKGGQVRHGLSGAPLLNMRTSRVCGMIKRTRNQSTDLGGRALAVGVVLHEFSQLLALQQAFHQQKKEWTGDAKSLEVFYSYAHKDEELRQDLDNHLALLRRQKFITVWHDHEIEAGQEFEDKIDSHLDTAHIILLLVSPAFMGSDYCFDKEMMRAMERHANGSARVIPIILRPCDWKGALFGKLKALPRDGAPISTWPDRDEAFLDVAKGIRGVIQSLTGGTP